MSSKLVIAALCVLAVSGCKTEYFGAPLPCTTPPQGMVSVSGGMITVDPEHIVVCNSNVPITWRLDPQAPYAFRADGIIIDYQDGEFDDCRPGKNGTASGAGKTFVCLDLNKKHGTGGQRNYKYTVRLDSTDGSPAPQDKDPWIVND